jgi:hypothetical protein
MKAKAVITSKPRKQTTDAKQITLKTLRDLKATLYARAAITIKAYPEKAERIQKRVDADASKIAFAINLVSIKM